MLPHRTGAGILRGMRLTTALIVAGVKAGSPTPVDSDSGNASP